MNMESQIHDFWRECQITQPEVAVLACQHHRTTKYHLGMNMEAEICEFPLSNGMHAPGLRLPAAPEGLTEQNSDDVTTMFTYFPTDQW
jgi:hypothetical protein